MPVKIYDCSNSAERPKHRQHSLGPYENDIVTSLKQSAKFFNCVFVDDYTQADVAFTNDVFPAPILQSSIYKVKRMDGTFWRHDLTHRNKILNQSARQANHVIFISRFSRSNYHTLYGDPLQKETVIINRADPSIFKPTTMKKTRKTIVCIASATNWNREEKRFVSLLELATAISEKIILLGKCSLPVPRNITKLGYIEDNNTVNRLLNHADVFINVSYMDAAPKVVCQAVACNLPILYADSGGVKELVDVGVPIQDDQELSFRDRSPKLSLVHMLSSYTHVKENINTFRKYMLDLDIDHSLRYFNMLQSYFRILKGGF